MVSGKPDGPDTTLVQPSDWDAPHMVSGIETADLGGDITAAGKVLLTGANAAAQRTTLGLAAVAATGAAADVTGLAAVATSGSGADLSDATVTLPKLQDIDAMTVLGNGEGSAGPVETLSISTLQAMVGMPVGASLLVLKKTADTVFASATPADVPLGASGSPAVTFSVLSGRYYYFRFVALVRSDMLTIGPSMSVTVPAFTRFGASGKLIGSGADGLDCEWQGAITASDDAVLPGNVAVVDTDYIFTIEGVLVPSANGLLTLRARTETGTTNITVRQGTIGMLWDLGA
ncbi:MAG TPA: hypothetical protein VFO62_10380 [Candidatus Binatia bacterium]|nr:hypothetical protein [Candidatus Binatia bacterium]